MRQQVLHVARAFSAQPTLGECLGDATIVEAPLAEALTGTTCPDLIWVSSATPADVDAVRRRFPGAGILATPERRPSAHRVVDLIAAGADLVLDDEGVMLAAAGLTALSRRRQLAGTGRPAEQVTGRPAEQVTGRPAEQVTRQPARRAPTTTSGSRMPGPTSSTTAGASEDHRFLTRR